MAAPWDKVDSNHGTVLPSQPHGDSVSQSQVYILLVIELCRLSSIILHAVHFNQLAYDNTYEQPAP